MILDPEKLSELIDHKLFWKSDYDSGKKNEFNAAMQLSKSINDWNHEINSKFMKIGQDMYYD